VKDQGEIPRDVGDGVGEITPAVVIAQLFTVVPSAR
jgi:hypothetical protein